MYDAWQDSNMIFGWGVEQGKQRALKGKSKLKASKLCEGSTSQAVLPKGASASGASTSDHVQVQPGQECVHSATLEDKKQVESTTGTYFSWIGPKYIMDNCLLYPCPNREGSGCRFYFFRQGRVVRTYGVTV